MQKPDYVSRCAIIFDRNIGYVYKTNITSVVLFCLFLFLITRNNWANFWTACYIINWAIITVTVLRRYAYAIISRGYIRSINIEIWTIKKMNTISSSRLKVPAAWNNNIFKSYYFTCFKWYAPVSAITSFKWINGNINTLDKPN